MRQTIKFKVDGFTLPGLKWNNNNQPSKAVVLIVHGMVEHIRRYHDFATFLADHNFIVYGYDQRGHGMSVTMPLEIGHINNVDNFNTLVSDLNNVIVNLREKHQDLPIFILGHSMGAFVAQAYLIDYNASVNGVILSGSNGDPGNIINFGIMISKIICKLYGPSYRSKFIYKLVFGAYNKKCKTPKNLPNWLTRDKEKVIEYSHDNLCGGICSAAFFRDFFVGLKHISKNYPKISPDLPIFILSGTDDPVGRYGKGLVKLATDLPTQKDKLMMKLYPEGRHEILNEINKDEVYQDVLNWLNNYI